MGVATEDARLDEANLTAWPPGLFRFIHLLGAGAWIGFGVAIAQMVPDRWDPISIRALMAGLYVAVAIVSWTERLAWRPLRRLALAVYVITTFHAFVMVRMNDGNLAYALVLVLNNLSISAGLDRPREQLAWGLYSTLGAAITWSLIPHSQTPIGFTVLALATFHSIFTGVYRRVWTALSSAHTEQALFTATFDSSGDALFLLTVGGDIARANAQAVALFRTTEAELVGRPYSVLVASTEPLRMRRDDDTTFSAEVVHETLPGDAGAVVRVSDVTQALQDRALLQDALQRAEAAATTKGTFIATM
ncbi:MAG: hypothetical protein KC933_39665, partial [Myxococcales bacterium]|nr:hypothetical protein [Myxococcales bacterium]